MAARLPGFQATPVRLRSRGIALLLAAAGFAALLALASPAWGGQASSGQLLFYPCTTCHPVSPSGQPLHPLPNDFKGHGIVLTGHDVLGTGAAACLACHDDPTRNPGMLKSVNGTLVDLSVPANIPLVCERCHFDKYRDWKAGTHGKHLPSCTSQGCHDPHTPQYIFAGAATPFVGTGWQFKAVGERQPFMALAAPAPDPAIWYPAWVGVVAALGFAVAAVLVGRLVTIGRSKR